MSEETRTKTVEQMHADEHASMMRVLTLLTQNIQALSARIDDLETARHNQPPN